MVILKLKAMSIDKLSNLYIEKEELLKGYLSDIESQNFLKGSFEYRELIKMKNELELNIIQIEKELRNRTK